MFDLRLGNCIEVMKGMADCSVDSIVTDPPYELGFMGKAWDSTGITNNVEMWREALRVLKPGGHLLAFGGSRTYHRMTCAIEDAGFEVRDQIMWLYGTGFPKSMNVSKAIDKEAGAKREVIGDDPQAARRNKTTSKFSDVYGEINDAVSCPITAPATPEAKQWDGWGTALKPAHEPICVARKPVAEKTIAANVLKYGTGAINIDACRVEFQDDADKQTAKPGGKATAKSGNLAGKTQEESGLTERTEFVAVQGAGRWPANVIHDGSDEVLEAFPTDKKTATGKIKISSGTKVDSGWSESKGMNTAGRENTGVRDFGDAGSAARFFYCAKASKTDRGVGNNHPTVKPSKLMQYLVTLVTPPGGTVLDMFMGSGSTGVAAINEGFNFVGIEMEESYLAIAKARMSSLRETEAVEA